ncbi:MAG: hypothetical protein C5B47_03160 [Verrucomicrobia bacterium]|nr:MAG: hypothetical protein C5B47_03160 [Verrucomicrobiota bacterium]
MPRLPSYIGLPLADRFFWLPAEMSREKKGAVHPDFRTASRSPAALGLVERHEHLLERLAIVILNTIPPMVSSGLPRGSIASHIPSHQPTQNDEGPFFCPCS